MRIDSAEFVISANRRDQFLRDDRPQIAFVGRSNVGKSSLMNRLLGRKGLARTSSKPGRTQAVNYFLVNRRFYFVDLPGYGFARATVEARQRWAILIEQYFQHVRMRALLVHLIDGKVGATNLDLQAAEYLRGMALEPLVVATKIDKVSRGRRAKALTEIRKRLELPKERDVVAFSATSGEGSGQLWKGITAFLNHGKERPG